jgi:chromosome partitioning protein
MQIITIASQKGGVGKSMLTRHLAVEIERTGVGPVAITDADPQGGSVMWWRERKAETPILIESKDGIKVVEETARRMGFRFLIIDTPPNLTETVQEAIGMADIVIVPSKPSPDDIRAIAATVRMIRRARKPMFFILNMVKPRVKMTDEANILLSGHAAVSPIRIGDRALYAASGIDGRTAQEMRPNDEAAEEISKLWGYVQTQLMEEVAA